MEEYHTNHSINCNKVQQNHAWYDATVFIDNKNTKHHGFVACNILMSKLINIYIGL